MTATTKKNAKRPFIACYFDALEEAEAAARLAGIDDDRVIGGLIRLWRHCWRKKTTRIDASELGAFFKEANEKKLEKLRKALARDFLHLSEDPEVGDSVRGAELYLRIRDARSKGGHASKSNLKRGKEPGSSRGEAGHVPEHLPGTVPALPATSDQRAALEAQLQPGTSASAEPPVAPEAPLDGTFVSFRGWCQARRSELGHVAEPLPGAATMVAHCTAYVNAREAVGNDVTVLQSAFGEYLHPANEFPASLKPPYPLVCFLRTFNRYVPPKPPKPTIVDVPVTPELTAWESALYKLKANREGYLAHTMEASCRPMRLTGELLEVETDDPLFAEWVRERLPSTLQGRLHISSPPLQEAAI